VGKKGRYTCHNLNNLQHTMNLKFTKMHGLGNDFMVVDAVRQKVDLTPMQIAQLGRRDIGIGFDQCLIVEPSRQEGIDFFYRIFNANGQEVGQCGNGARCLARFVHHYQLTSKRTLQVATHTTRMGLQINDDDSVTVDMGLPKFEPRDIPLSMQDRQTHYSISFPHQPDQKIHAVSMGNPHAVLVVPDLDTAPVQTLGQLISEHPLFPEQTNVGFMCILRPERVQLRVYERGCGETQACGSGAAAAVAIGRLYHHLAPKVSVELKGGRLTVEWPSFNETLSLTGPAAFVYEGELLLL
jgi:diaminopimelate epimerase